METLSASEIRKLAEKLQLNPSKSLGQNFVVDGNTCRKILRLAQIKDEDVVLEIGPGLGSLTIALLAQAKSVVAIEIDKRLADQLPETISTHLPEKAGALTVIHDDALKVHHVQPEPTALVANLPYNVSVPVLIHVLENFPTIERGIVMVQAEVAQRLAAKPGSKVYGVPSVKLKWWADSEIASTISREVFCGEGIEGQVQNFHLHAPFDHLFRGLCPQAVAQKRGQAPLQCKSAVSILNYGHMHHRISGENS